MTVFVGKSLTPFNLHLNNCRSDIFDRSAIPTCRYFTQGKYKFNKHTKLTLIESITNINKPKESLQKLLKHEKTLD